MGNKEIKQPLSFSILPKFRRKIVKLAAKNKRTISAELEARIVWSLLHENKKLPDGYTVQDLGIVCSECNGEISEKRLLNFWFKLFRNRSCMKK